MSSGLAAGAAARSGVPQGHHVHGLLALGAEVLEGYFPGLRAEPEQAGAPVWDWGEGLCAVLPEGTPAPMPMGMPIQTFSRPLLEHVLRGRVTGLEAVTLRDGPAVTGLLTAGPGRVTGVRVKGSDGEDEIVADLVVDAWGRSSHLPQWLGSLGLPSRKTAYHRLPRWPHGLIALGDSVCTFSPAYGQGMTIAAPEGRLLEQMLRSRRNGTPLDGQGFQKGLARLTAFSWLMATIPDRAWKRPGPAWPVKAGNWFMDRLIDTVPHDPRTYTAFSQLFHMTAGPLALADTPALPRPHRPPPGREHSVDQGLTSPWVPARHRPRPPAARRQQFRRSGSRCSRGAGSRGRRRASPGTAPSPPRPRGRPGG
ncbi:hypothetical protein ABZ924_19295 [Streptomyces sp. NPDC046876]|uniref:FAD-dependent oxidoreductase n=1 Tax=Streptomyces sp. NPDC046876 TaxID=3155616 RepID=UPI0033C1A58B